METLVQTKSGLVKGTQQDGLNTWFGIPFAQAPVGNLRFKRAQPVEPWTDTLVTDHHGNKPYQFYGQSKTPEKESEDALTLSIWRPDTEQKNLPVFVYIYGGGYSMGELSDPGYDGANFARNDVIYVGFNYRIGVLGFYDFSMFDDSFETNAGLSDQIMALKWIKENIVAFGGDPEMITIDGESAGGSSVVNLLAAPQAKGLFNQAIAQSALPDAIHTHDSIKPLMAIFLKQLNLAPESVDQLKQMPVEEMMSAAQYLYANTNKWQPGYYMPAPVIDDLLPERPLDAIENGSAADVKLIIGTMQNEGHMIAKMVKIMPDDWADAQKMFALNQLDDRFDGMKNYYSHHARGEKNQVSDLITDRVFRNDSIAVAQSQSKYQSTWMYEIDYAPIMAKLFGLGATHALDVPLVLDTLGQDQTQLFWRLTPRKNKEQMRDQLNSMWLNFVKTGNPGQAWPQYNAQKRDVYFFNQQSKVISKPYDDVMALWQGIHLYR